MRTLSCDKCKLALTEKENKHLSFTGATSGVLVEGKAELVTDVVTYDLCGNCYCEFLEVVKKYLS